MSLQYVRNGIGISANIWGRGDWKESIITGEASPELIGSFRDIFQERFITLSYAREICHNLSLGISGKYIFTLEPDRQAPEQYKLLKDTQGITIDFGILYKISNHLSCGVNLENLISLNLDYVIFSDFGNWAFPNELPNNISIGFSYLPSSNLSFSLDMRNLFEDGVFDKNHKVDYQFKRSYHFGCEWNWIRNVFINFGYYKSRRPTAFPTYIEVPFDYNSYNTYSLGLGCQFNSMQINIGIVADDRASKMEEFPVHLSNNTLSGSFSLSYKF